EQVAGTPGRLLQRAVYVHDPALDGVGRITAADDGRLPGTPAVQQLELVPGEAGERIGNPAQGGHILNVEERGAGYEHREIVFDHQGSAVAGKGVNRAVERVRRPGSLGKHGEFARGAG